MAGFQNSSDKVDNKLNSPDCTIESLFEEEELLQELRGKNQKLLTL
jgi:hypothetical protein